MRTFHLLATLALAACAPAIAPETARRTPPDITLPPMKTFAARRAEPPTRSNASIAQDFLDLSLRLESGRELPVFTRFEGPITVRITGAPPPSLGPDLDQLLSRLRSEAGIAIGRVPATSEASITIEVLSRRDLQRSVPQAACFVVPRVTSWDEFRRDRRSAKLDWTTLKTRNRMAIFMPGDVAPQEVRDCLHEELAQAIGPLNDLYRLSDSVFNDDNFHTVLTGFDMLILRTFYSPDLRSGMSRGEVAARLPAILNRINPRGGGVGMMRRSESRRDWIDAIETALGPRTSSVRRRAAAKNAVRIAREAGWNDNRLAFSLFALGRLTLGTEPELALASFLQAGTIYARSRETRLQEAHVAMQLAAFALSSGQADVAVRIVDSNIGAVEDGQNAALLATLLMVKAEALELLGRTEDARAIRSESLGWARYGFGPDADVRKRAAEIARLRPPLPESGPA